MTKKDIPVVSFVGRSNTGKTTVIERLIPLLKNAGLRIAVIKHHHRDFEVDKPGKDTYRYKQAGAQTTMLTSPHKLAVIQDVDTEPGLREIIERFVHGVDLVIVEGYKKEKIPKIEVFQRRSDTPVPLCGNDENLVAIITDESIESLVPVLKRDHIQAVADLILHRFIRKKDI